MIKGSRFLLLRGQRLVKDDVDQTRFFPKPTCAGRIWGSGKHQDRQAAEHFLDSWTAQARSLANKHFSKLAHTLDNRRQGILAYYDHPITTGPLEGFNNKSRVLKRQACGFRNHEYFKRRLYFLPESTLAFSG